MKTILNHASRITHHAIIVAFAILATGSLPAQTPVVMRTLTSTGAAKTSAVVMQPYPPLLNGFTVVGTNIIYGFGIITNTPDGSGFWSNTVFGNTYKVTQDGQSFFAIVPNTTNVINLATVATNSPVIAGPVGSFALITNWLGYTPMIASYPGLTNAIGYTPATNTPTTNTLIYIASITGITNATGGITNFTYTLGTNVIYYQQR